MPESARGADPPPLVLLAHGCPDPRHAEGVERLARQVGSQLRGVPVSVAYLQHNRPALAEAVAQFGAAGGPSPVRVLPLLLTAGGHLADDVPTAVAGAKAAVPGIVVEPLAPMPAERLAPAVLAAVGRASGTAPGALDEATLRIVLVTAGSERAGAMAPFDALATAVAAGGAAVSVANGPRSDVDRAVAEVSRSKGGDGFAVPVMYAQGKLPDIAVDRAASHGFVATDVVGALASSAYALASWVEEQPINPSRKASGAAPVGPS